MFVAEEPETGAVTPAQEPVTSTPSPSEPNRLSKKGRPSEVDKTYVTFSCPITVPGVSPVWTRSTSMSIVSMFAKNGNIWRLFTRKELIEYMEEGADGPDHRIDDAVIEKLALTGMLIKIREDEYVPASRFIEIVLNRPKIETPLA